jgi:hypothetical protein
MRRPLVYCALLSVSAFSALSSSAATITLQQGLNGYTGTRDDDAVKSAGAGAYSNKDDNLYAFSAIDGTNLGTVVGFDASEIPSGVTINSATLEMTFDNASYGNGNSVTWAVKDPAVQWVEGEVNFVFAQNTGAGVLWNSSDSDVFGPGYSSDTGITMVNQPTVATASSSGATGQTLSFDVTSIVSGWETGAANNGFAVIPISGDPASNFFWAGKANPTESYRPALVIDYSSVPEPTSAALTCLGATMLLGRRRKK